ncbi:DUF3558 family protein [Actinokineospora sp. HUAS TT18]|uniref:DUF3558 family protein n=1 Tax=Actinokineospora sp. HUAS TT18 TaxID=3447451 RepID=UPI003F524770
MRTIVTLILASAFALTACSEAAAPPPASGSTSASQAPTSAAAKPSRDLAGVDPCALLTAAELTPILRDTPPDPKRENADGQVGCAWGDGEFRGVWLSFATASAVPPVQRPVRIGARSGGVVEELEYTCDVRVEIDGVGIDLRAVASDKTDWCPEATTALTAAVAKLGW